MGKELSDAARAVRAEYMREYRKKNAEKLREYNNRYWEKKAQKLLTKHENMDN